MFIKLRSERWLRLPMLAGLLLSWGGEVLASAVVTVQPYDTPAQYVWIYKGSLQSGVARFGEGSGVVGDTDTDILRLAMSDPTYPDATSYTVQIYDPHVRCQDAGQSGWRLDLTTWLNSSSQRISRGSICAMFAGTIQTQSKVTLYKDKLIFSRNDSGARAAAALTVYYRDIHDERRFAGASDASSAISSTDLLRLLSPYMGGNQRQTWADNLEANAFAKYFDVYTASQYQLRLCAFQSVQLLCDINGKRFYSRSTLDAADLLAVSRWAGQPFPVTVASANFVVDDYGHLFAISARDAVVPWYNMQGAIAFHSAFTGAGPVRAAGEMTVINGVIVQITNNAPSYLPSCERIKGYMPKYLAQFGYTGDQIRAPTYECID